MSKIAFCFLIIDTIHNQKLWEYFFDNIDKDKYNVYIHYKKNTDLGKFEKYKLSKCVPTKWDHISLVHAYNVLFTEAFKDKQNKKFVILSGNCIPFKSFDHVYETLTKDDYGYFSSSTDNSSCFPRCNNLLKHFPKDKIFKSSGWFILNRTLVEKLCFLSKEEVEKKFNINAPDEHYYITLIHYYELFDQIKITNGAENDTTFTNWGSSSYIYSKGVVCKKHPKLYTEITKEEYDYLKSSFCMFGRKFYNNFLILDNFRPFCTIQ